MLIFIFLKTPSYPYHRNHFFVIVFFPSSLHSSEKKLTFSLRFYRCQKNSVALSNNRCYHETKVPIREKLLSGRGLDHLSSGL